MKNVQIRFDEELLEIVDRLAESAQLSRSAAVREALKSWIRGKQLEAFETGWIWSLRADPGGRNTEADEAWCDAQGWSDEGTAASRTRARARARARGRA